MNQQISCQADSDVTNRRACAAASCPIASTASASGGVPPRDGAQHRVSGVGADEWPRPAAVRSAAWRHLTSRAP